MQGNQPCTRSGRSKLDAGVPVGHSGWKRTERLGSLALFTKLHEGHSRIASHKEWRSAGMETDGGAAILQEHVLRATSLLSHCNSATLPPDNLYLPDCPRVI